jgi:hypothetical protein
MNWYKDRNQSRCTNTYNGLTYQVFEISVKLFRIGTCMYIISCIIKYCLVNINGIICHYKSTGKDTYKQRSEKNMHKTNDLYCNNLGPTLYFFFLWNTNMRSIIFSLCYMLFFIQVPVPSVSVLPPFTDSDYPFGIFNLFLTP